MCMCVCVCMHVCVCVDRTWEDKSDAIVHFLKLFFFLFRFVSLLYF